MKKLKFELKRLVTASVCALLATGITALVHQNRDFFFEWDWARPQGTFVPGVDESQVKAIRDFVEQLSGQPACVAKGLGHDDKYLYIAMGCGAADGAFSGARVIQSGGTITSIEQPIPGAYENGLRRLFPREAFEQMRYGFSLREFHKLTLARLDEKLKSASP